MLTLLNVQKQKIALFLTFSLMLCTSIFVYGLERYQLHRNLAALQSEQQVQHCGSYQQTVYFQQFPNLKPHFYQFKLTDGQLIEFNGEALTQHYYPLLVQLQAGERICFGYAQDVQDWDGRYYLTFLKREQQPLASNAS